MKNNKRWFRMKNTLSSASRKPKMVYSVVIMKKYKDLSTLFKYSINVHHNRLVLEQWTKRWMTVSSSKLQNQESIVLCLPNKKSFWLRYRVLYKPLYWKHCYLESIVVIRGRV